MPEIHIGPPFSNFRVFREFPSAADGAWAVARLNTTSGQMVLQLGGQPPKAYRDDVFAGAGFEGDLHITVANTYTFSVSVDVGPVSMLPRGFTAATSIDFGIDFVDGRSEIFRPPGSGGVVGAYYGLHTMAFSAHLQPGTYVFAVAVGALINYTGTPNPAPYAEMIATYRNAMQVSSGATALAGEPAATPWRRPKRHERVVRPISDAEMAAEGVITLSSK